MKALIMMLAIAMLLLTAGRVASQHVPEAERYRISAGGDPAMPPAGYWQKTWGAMSPSPVGGVLGTALGASSKRAAARLALKDCKKKGGGACDEPFTFFNQCAVMILGDNIYRLASAGSIEEAAELGIDACSREDTNCQLYYSACTEPIFHKY